MNYGLLIGFIVFIIIIIAIYFAYRYVADLIPNVSTNFCAESAALGTENGPGCEPGKNYLGGLCYTDYWTAEGGEKTAVCTVNYGTYGGLVTDCFIGIQDLSIGDKCTMVGPGYHKTAVCTCQKKGIVTAAKYCESPTIPETCKPGWDYYGTVCYKNACPAGSKRTSICGCSKI